MSFQLHEWDIHAICFGTDGVRVTGVRFRVRAVSRHVGNLDRLADRVRA